MGLETTNTIGGLDASWPIEGDPTSQGNDHIQLLKGVLKNIFPGRATDPNADPGNGFTQPILANEIELNYLIGAEGNIQDQIAYLAAAGVGSRNQLSAPIGGRMLYNGATPSGWVTVTDHDGKMCVINDESISGGDMDPTTLVHSHVGGAHTLTYYQIPAHFHRTFGRRRVMVSTDNVPGNEQILVDGNEPVERPQITENGVNNWADRVPEAHSHSISSTTMRPRYQTMKLIERVE